MDTVHCIIFALISVYTEGMRQMLILSCSFSIQSNPDKDTDIVSVKATLKNSEKLSFQVAWNMDTMHSTIEGLKERMPAIADVLLKFINKYHTAHFGFDVNRASMKLKNSVSNVIERAYHEVPMGLDTLQNFMREMFGS